MLKQKEQDYVDNKRVEKVGVEQYKKEKIDSVLSDLERLGIKVK